MPKKAFKISPQNDNRNFAIVASVLQIVMIVLFAIYVDYPKAAKVRDLKSFGFEELKNSSVSIVSASNSDSDSNGNSEKDKRESDPRVINLLESSQKKAEKIQSIAISAEAAGQDTNKFYPMFQDVHTMIFIGFGFLMTFLKRYSYSSVGLNLLLAAFAIQWSSIVFGLMHRSDGDPKIYADMSLMINAEFTAGTVLISFGAVLGKTTPLQLLVMTLIEVVVSKVAEYICVHEFHATDVGGSMFIHAFGAYFGLALSAALFFKRKDHLESENEVATKTSDVFAMIGTVFLWMFWPSFNGALAEDALRQRAIINTYFALAGAAITCFAMSALVEPRHRFNMVHIQNASLAGGVAVGTCADLLIGPYAALIIGSLAATVSVIGYRFMTPKLNAYIHDTCGVHDLHGMPGVIGALAGVLFTGLGLYDGNPESSQAQLQILSLLVILAFAIVGGLLTGIFLRIPIFRQIREPNEFYDDHRYWHVPVAHVGGEGFVDLHIGGAKGDDGAQDQQV